MMKDDQRFKSVWDALAKTPGEASLLKMRAALMDSLRAHIEATFLNQSDAAIAAGVTQPRISDLMRGRFSRFNLESLIEMAERFNMRVELVVKPVSLEKALVSKFSSAKRISVDLLHVTHLAQDVLNIKQLDSVVLPESVCTYADWRSLCPTAISSKPLGDQDTP